MFIADLRSDTLTRPTPAMRQVMAQAEVGDDVFGEDPSVLALEAHTADLFQREAALFVASGTMANQIAIRLHTRPGDEALVGRHAHSILYETGGAAVLSGVTLREVGLNGIFTRQELESEILPLNIHHSVTRLVMVENTHNRAGGRVFPLEDLRAIRALTQTQQLALHMDGARIFNACLASGVEPAVYGALVDTLSCCLSKGLGAPVGSMLVGDREVMREARRIRKQLGGGLRQAGILAAAGEYALRHHVERLREDHTRALQLAQALQGLPGIGLERLPETNIVLFTFCQEERAAAWLVARMEQEGVRILAMNATTLRAVLHLDVTQEAVDGACLAFQKVLSPLASS